MPTPITSTVIELLKLLMTEEQAKFIHVFKKPSLNIEELKQKSKLDEAALNKTLKDLDSKETWSLVPLVLIVVWLGVYPKPVLEPIDNSVKAMLSFMDEKAITQEAKDMIKVAKNKEVK